MAAPSVLVARETGTCIGLCKFTLYPLFLNRHVTATTANLLLVRKFEYGSLQFISSREHKQNQPKSGFVMGFRRTWCNTNPSEPLKEVKRPLETEVLLRDLLDLADASSLARAVPFYF